MVLCELSERLAMSQRVLCRLCSLGVEVAAKQSFSFVWQVCDHIMMSERSVLLALHSLAFKSCAAVQKQWTRQEVA